MGDLHFVLSACTEFVYYGCCHFDNGATSKIDDNLTEHGELLHVLPLAVQLNFFDKQVVGTILAIKFSVAGTGLEVPGAPGQGCHPANTKKLKLRILFKSDKGTMLKMLSQ